MSSTGRAKLYLLGFTLCAALTTCSLYSADRGGPYFIAYLAVAGIAYLLAIRELFLAPRLPRRFIVVGLVLAALWHVQFLRMPPGPDDDVHRYVWDGRLQRLGYNPYNVVPSDPEVSKLHTPETRNLNNPNLPSPYPAGAQLFFRIVTAIQESTFALRVAFVICDFGVVFVLLDVLRRNEQGAHLVLAYAWNPLLAIEVAGSGHIDILGALLLIVSFAALCRRWRAIAAVSFGLAVAVKLLPIVLLPVYWKRVRLQDAAFAAGVVGLLYLPFLKQGHLPIGSLVTYVQTFRFNDPAFAMLERVAPQIAAGLPVVVGFLTAIWMRSKSPGLSPDVLAWPMAATLLCAPVVYPWYLLWLLPFLTSPLTLPIIIWTVSVIPIYMVWYLRTLGRSWSLPVWAILLEYGPVALAGVITTCSRFRRPAASRYLLDWADSSRDTRL